MWVGGLVFDLGEFVWFVGRGSICMLVGFVAVGFGLCVC